MDEDKSIQTYRGNGLSNNAINTIASLVLYADQGKAYVDSKMFEANVKGIIWQVEADVILEHELGLGSRIKKWW